MYKIRAKKGFNLVIKDLGITLRSSNTDWTIVSEDAFDNSEYAQKLKNYILVDGVDNEPKIIVKTVDETNDTNTQSINEVAPGSFVVGKNTSNPEDVFIATPTTSPEAKTTSAVKVPANAIIAEGNSQIQADPVPASNIKVADPVLTAADVPDLSKDKTVTAKEAPNTKPIRNTKAKAKKTK